MDTVICNYPRCYNVATHYDITNDYASCSAHNFISMVHPLGKGTEGSWD